MSWLHLSQDAVNTFDVIGNLAPYVVFVLGGLVWCIRSWLNSHNGLADLPSVDEVKAKRNRKRPGSSAMVIKVINTMLKPKDDDNDDDFDVNVGIR